MRGTVNSVSNPGALPARKRKIGKHAAKQERRKEKKEQLMAGVSADAGVRKKPKKQQTGRPFNFENVNDSAEGAEEADGGDDGDDVEEPNETVGAAAVEGLGGECSHQCIAAEEDRRHAATAEFLKCFRATENARRKCGVIVFARDARAVAAFSKHLLKTVKKGVATLHDPHREEGMAELALGFKSGKVHTLIAVDTAVEALARRPEVTSGAMRDVRMVLHMDFPQTLAQYTQRLEYSIGWKLSEVLSVVFYSKGQQERPESAEKQAIVQYLLLHGCEGIDGLRSRPTG